MISRIRTFSTVAVVCGLAMVGCEASDYESGGSSGYDAESDAQETSSVSADPDTRHSWTGTGGKTTDIFTMDDDQSWSIETQAQSDFPQGAVMAVAVKKPDGELVQQTEMGLGSNRTFIHSRGDFYIEVITANLTGWEVVAKP